MILMVRVLLTCFDTLSADTPPPVFISVLTKVVVYAGIGAIATILVPATFEALGWGV